MNFTETELHILECLASEWVVEEIAEELEMDPKTVIVHIARIKNKIGFPKYLQNGHAELCRRAAGVFSYQKFYVPLKQG